MQNKVKTLGILAIKKEQRIGQRTMSYEIIDITIVRGLQQFDQYNLILIKSNWNQNRQK